jgi:hypothetical protein
MVVALALGGVGLAGCSLGQGQGQVHSNHLIAHDCWTGAYDLQPDFFSSIPYRDTQEIRVQRGTQVVEVSDGLSIQIDSSDTIRQGILANGGAPTTFAVALPVGLHAPGTPIEPPPVRENGQAPLVHMALYLQYSCHNQNVILYGVSGSVTFASLFDGDPDEKDAAQKFTNVTAFDVQVGDPRDAPLGEQAYDIPAELQTRLTGNLQFYFERGQPGQPFP